MRPQPKKKTPRDSAYLRFIRGKICCFPECDSTCTDPHHSDTGGTALVGSDYSAVPMCLDHHRLIHQKYAKSGYWPEDELKSMTAGYLADYREAVKGNVKALRKIDEQLNNAW